LKQAGVEARCFLMKITGLQMQKKNLVTLKKSVDDGEN
jgi:hypothetical protein